MDELKLHSHRFELKHAVRKGGNSVVFKAYHYDAGRYVRTCAVKLLSQLDEPRRDRFANEVEVQSALEHDRVATLYTHGEVVLPPVGEKIHLNEDVTVPWAAIGLGGKNLRESVESEGPLPLPQLRVAIEDIGAAIDHVHARGFIHRDIKPANFVWEMGKSRVMMIDFGIAKRFGDDVSGRPLDHFTKQMEFVGPVFFSSPELIAYAGDKDHPVDHRSDVFQLGKLAWYLATGVVTGGVPALRVDPTAGRLRDVILQIMSDDPSDRPSTAIEAMEAILDAVS